MCPIRALICKNANIEALLVLLTKSVEMSRKRRQRQCKQCLTYDVIDLSRSMLLLISSHIFFCLTGALGIKSKQRL